MPAILPNELPPIFMTECIDSGDNRLELNDKNLRIKELNDNFRRTFVGGTVLLTQGVEAIEPDLKRRVLIAIREFDDFT